MTVELVKTGIIETNTYLVFNEGKAVIIDPGSQYDKITARLKALDLSVAAVLLTHGHFDHINAAAQFQRAGARIFIHELDAYMAADKHASSGGLSFVKINTFVPDVILTNGDKIKLCGLEFEVLHTPGHTAGSVCFICGDRIFSGDTLFYMDIGRSDLPSGDEDALQDSIKKKLFCLGRDYEVLPGHGESTSLFFEKKNNPYV